MPSGTCRPGSIVLFAPTSITSLRRKVTGRAILGCGQTPEPQPSLFRNGFGFQCMTWPRTLDWDRLGGMGPGASWPRRYSSGNTISSSEKLSMVSLRQKSFGKEEETRTLKSFVETLRVRIPPGKTEPAARSESCAGSPVSVHHSGKSGVSSSFLPEKMNRHRAKKLGKGESLQP